MCCWRRAPRPLRHAPRRRLKKFRGRREGRAIAALPACDLQSSVACSTISDARQLANSFYHVDAMRRTAPRTRLALLAMMRIGCLTFESGSRRDRYWLDDDPASSARRRSQDQPHHVVAVQLLHKLDGEAVGESANNAS